MMKNHQSAAKQAEANNSILNRIAVLDLNKTEYLPPVTLGICR